MSHFDRVWTGMLTKTAGNSQTNSPIALVINQRNRDRVRRTFPDTSQSDQERGQANLYEVNTATAGVDSDALADTYLRLGIRGNDLWRPQHFVVWGRTASSGAVVPLGIETDIGSTLSTDAGEGDFSIPIRTVGAGNARMSINRLLVLMTTANRKHAGTNSRLNLTVTAAGNSVVNDDLPDTAQSDQERGEANWYFVPVNTAFSKSELTNASIRLSIEGPDAWRPTSVFIFGLDDAAGRPESLVPLVHLPNWPFGQMSTDSGEGPDSVLLPLA